MHNMVVLDKLFYTFQKTTLLAVGCLGVVLGVYGSLALAFSWVLLPFAVMFISYIPKRSLFSLILCLYLGFLLGLFRASLIQRNSALLENYLNQKVEVIAESKGEGFYDYRKRIAFDALVSSINLPNKLNVSAPIRVNSFVSTGVFTGDLVRVYGKLTSGYGSNLYTIGYAEVEVIGKSKSLMNNLRNNFITETRNVLPEPESAFAIGLLIGQKTGLSNELQDALRMSGLTHIIAVSGYNLTIIIRFVRRLSSKISRFQVLSISAALVLAFVGITGMSPSIMRALIVSVAMLLSWYFGRNPKPGVLILFAAAMSSLIEPLQVLRSVGWYLSFGAFTGVIIIAPILNEKLRRKTLLKSIIIESFSASLMTIPMIAFVFKQMSLTGILANCIVLPLIPVAMLGSILTYIGQVVDPLLGAVLSIPTKYILKFILDFAVSFSKMPGTDLDVNLSVITLVVFYGLILLAVSLAYIKKPKLNVLE